MRLLCLHGVGSNAAVLEAQLAVILKEFSEHEFHFLQGEIEVDPDNGLFIQHENETFAFDAYTFCFRSC
jgi:predicted esterase